MTTESGILMDPGAREKDVVESVMLKAEQMYNVARQSKRVDPISQLPELHVGVRGDPFQPSPQLQERCLLIFDAWLATGSKLTIVTKGVPATDGLRIRFLTMCSIYPESINFQCSCAGLNANAQRILEPFAPTPDERLEFLAAVMNAGVKHVSVRIDPLVPLINDGEDEIKEMLERIAKMGVRRVSMGFVVCSPDMIARFKQSNALYDAPLPTANSNRLVLFSLRRRRYEYAQNEAEKLGLSFSVCGCTNPDYHPEHRCSISWRSVPPWNW